MGICDGATSTARSIFFFIIVSFFRVLNSSRSGKVFCRALSLIRVHTVCKGYNKNNNNNNNKKKIMIMIDN